MSANTQTFQIPASKATNYLGDKLNLANRILDLIKSYGTTRVTNESLSGCAKATFLPVVLASIRDEAPIRMILPAFPAKSPNRKGKVLGALPDLGEEIALQCLQGLCDNIRQIYKPGAEISIASDGLVYNDLLHVSDEDVWSYGQALREMVREKKLVKINFVRVMDLLNRGLDQTQPTATIEEDRDSYLSYVFSTRKELIERYTPPGYDARKAIKEDPDTCLTYMGYVLFLKKDLEHIGELKVDKYGKCLSATQYTKVIKGIAQAMLARGAAFAAAIRATHGDHVRLSIHPTTGVTKFPVQLLPQKLGKCNQTPWHSTIALATDGSLITGYAEDFIRTHELVYRDGRPYFFREKSDVFDWGDLKVEFEPLYPCGLVVRPVESSTSVRDVPMSKVRQLSTTMSPVILSGFSDTLHEPTFIQKASEAGKILPWAGETIHKVVDIGDTSKMGNNTTSNEDMPMHFDGIFKLEERVDAVTGEVSKVMAPPNFQFFTAIATAPEGTGYTLFAPSRLIFQHLPHSYTVEQLEEMRWDMETKGYYELKLENLPMVVRHPVTNEPCIRWHETWDERKTRFSTAKVTFRDGNQEINEVIQKLIYDFRVCLRFSWEKGDWLLSDNIAMMHTRTGYQSECDRELWRIHLD